MSLEIVENIFTINLDMIITTAFAAILLVFGHFVVSKVNFLEKYCIPAAVVGGFIFMFITFIGYMTNTFAFNFDTTLQDFLMLMFFTTVGLGASLSILKKGGKLLIIYWLIAGFVSICQNIIGISVSKVVGLENAYGLLCSAISMIGGHGAGLSYGDTFLDMGYNAGPLVGTAAPTFGLISAVLIGGPIARKLIEKNNLAPDGSDDLDIDSSIENINVGGKEKLTSLDILKNVTAILICMALGTIVSGWISGLIDMSFPTYVGAMFIAVIVRNLNEALNLYKFDFSLVDGIGDVALGLYLSMAIMTLQIWDLVGLAGGMFAVLLGQVIFVSLFGYFIVFRLLGKNYDSAVMVAGMIGHTLGATPTAVVNLGAVTQKYGESRKAWMIVPIVGAFLVDLIYQPQTIWFIKNFVVDLTSALL